MRNFHFEKRKMNYPERNMKKVAGTDTAEFVVAELIDS